MKVLSKGNRWIGAETVPTTGSSEELVERGLLHPDMLNVAGLLEDGILPRGMVRLTDGPGGVPRYASYDDVLMTNPWGYGTINTIARGLARLPLKLYREKILGPSEANKEVEYVVPSRAGGSAGQIAWALRYPNAGGEITDAAPSRRALWYGTVVNKLIYGNAIWEIISDTGGIRGFKMHPFHTVVVDENVLVYKIYRPEYDSSVFQLDRISREQVPPEKVLTSDKVVHFGLWEGGRRPLNGSPVRALHNTVALYDAVSRHMTSFFSNGARVSGHMKVDPNTSNRALEQIRQEIIKLYAGPQSAGKVLISSGDWQAFHREPQFEGIVNLTKFSRDEIFVVYGVPPPVMGVIERAIMANAREMRDQYVRDLIGPHAEFLQGDFEAQVIDPIETLRLKGVVARFDVDEQLKPDLWKRAATFRNILLAYSPNELRGLEGQPPLAGKADPKGYAETIQRPLNESPINNLPDYVLRDELNERQIELQEKQAERQDEPAPNEPAPENNEEDNDDED